MDSHLHRIETVANECMGAAATAANIDPILGTLHKVVLIVKEREEFQILLFRLYRLIFTAIRGF